VRKRSRIEGNRTNLDVGQGAPESPGPKGEKGGPRKKGKKEGEENPDGAAAKALLGGRGESYPRKINALGRGKIIERPESKKKYFLMRSASQPEK